MNMMPLARMDIDHALNVDVLADNNAFLRKILELSNDCVKVLDLSGTVCFMNEPGLCLMEIDDFADVSGASWVSLWPEQEQPRIAEAIMAASLGRTIKLDAFCPTAKGTPKWWEVTVAPMQTGEGEQLVLAISHDITDRVRQSALMEELLAEKDLLMHEVHHRAKNSLQLVQGLLGIQSRAAGADSPTALQLTQSAARVRTIAALHDRLYRSQAALEVDVKPYLDSLVADIETSLRALLGDRRITFAADKAIWTANDVPALGLVLTELVTNAVRYGAGDVAVSFRQPEGEQGVITVTDQGGQLPEDFDPAASKGLGMKLVTNLLRERSGGALEFSVGDGVTCFVARMPRPALAAVAA